MSRHGQLAGNRSNNVHAAMGAALQETRPMPLLKLWNLLCGRSSGAKKPDDPSVRERRTTPVEHRTTPVEPEPKKKKKAAKARVLGIGGRRQHAALCKTLRSVTASTVLEISVGDGTRAAEILKTLSAKNENTRYIAIDEFELADGPVTLKRYHQSLRSENVRAQLFPGSIERGLSRVANTLGTIDLVLIATPKDRWQTPAVLPRLTRILHPNSLVLYLEDESWHRYEPVMSPLRRAA